MTIDEIDRNIGKIIKVQEASEGDTIFPIIPIKRVRSKLYWDTPIAENRYFYLGKLVLGCSHRDSFTLIFEEARSRYKNLD